jgi:ATP-dependent DNA helicase RecG
MSTALADLQRWMDAARESEHLEFKEAKNQYDTTKLMKYCVAIGNEGGGRLVLGVTDKSPRKVVGSQAFLNPTDIQNRILDKLGFRVDVEELTHPDGRVVIFHIPPSPDRDRLSLRRCLPDAVGRGHQADARGPASEDLRRR